MADTFDERSAFYREHRETWTNFTRWARRGTILAALLVIIALYFIVT